MAATDMSLEHRGLPVNLDAERFVLGSILMDDAVFLPVAAVLRADDFTLEKHRRIFARMNDLYERGERIDRVSAGRRIDAAESTRILRWTKLSGLAGRRPATHLQFGRLYPIVKDKSLLRKIIFTAQKTIDRAMFERKRRTRSWPEQKKPAEVGESRATNSLANPAQIIEEFQGGLNAFLDPSRRIKGSAPASRSSTR